MAGDATNDYPKIPEFYFVAFVDLLGQSDELAALGRVPKDETDRTAILRGILGSGSVVRNVRNSFSQLFRSRESTPQDLERMAPEQREGFAKISTFRMFQTGFSDSVAIVVPLHGLTGKGDSEGLARSSVALWNALFGLAATSLASLAHGLPFRAGADVGLGVEMFPNEVYGPVLLSAYHLESRVAEYPRTALGDQLFSYLDLLERRAGLDMLGDYAATMARRSRELVCQAPDDGWNMLHFLSPVVLGAPSDFTDPAATAAGWVMREVERHAVERNEKLYRRYVRLARYFQSSGVNPSSPSKVAG